jgi:small subunit ribosomal protein S20
MLNMPHTESAKKSLRQTEKRNARNKAAKKAIKTQIKKFLATLKDGSAEQKMTEFKLAVKKLDKAASAKVLHRNTVSRRKSQLARMLAVKPAAK